MVHMDLTDIYLTFPPKTKEFTLFSAPHLPFSKIDQYIWSHNSPQKDIRRFK